VQCREATQMKQVLITGGAGEQTGARTVHTWIYKEHHDTVNVALAAPTS